MQTIQDLITKRTQDAAQLALDQKAAAQVAGDTSALTADDVALGAAITTSGPVFTTNTDGSITVYEPDGASGYVQKTAQPASSVNVPASSPSN